MLLDQAIKKIGKAMGEAKYDDAMGGAMLPSGNLDAADTLSIVFGVNSKSIEVRLREAMDIAYKRIIDVEYRRVKRKRLKKPLAPKKKKRVFP